MNDCFEIIAFGVRRLDAALESLESALCKGGVKPPHSKNASRILADFLCDLCVHCALREPGSLFLGII